MSLRVSLVQQPLVWNEPAVNRDRFQSLLAPLAGKTDLVVLPETFTTGFSMDVERIGEPAGGPTTDWLRRMAKQLDAAVMGSVVTEDAGKYYNRLHWVTPDGALRTYDKRHLFRMGREHEHFTPGANAWSVEWRGLKVCPLVCYDLRFPVYSRRRPDLEYDVLIYVANWPAARTRAWRLLRQARAMENQAFVIGVNRIGADGNGIDHAGDTAADDFLGNPLADLGSQAEIRTVELDPAALRAFREKFPAQLDADRFHLEL
jgi:omega-amidase